MLTFDWDPDTEMRAEAVERFRKTGALPPEGVKLLGRWTRADFSGDSTSWRQMTQRSFLNSLICGGP